MRIFTLSVGESLTEITREGENLGEVMRQLIIDKLDTTQIRRVTSVPKPEAAPMPASKEGAYLLALGKIIERASGRNQSPHFDLDNFWHEMVKIASEAVRVSD